MNNISILCISTLFSLVVSTTVNAKLYRWVDGNNVTHYTNTPPPETTSKEVVNSSTGIKDLPEKKDSKVQKVETKQDVEPEKVPIPPIVTLKGTWCEYTVEENDGNKYTGLWTFGVEYIQFNSLLTDNTIAGHYTIEGGDLSSDNPELDGREILSKKSLILTISYDKKILYWRRGACPNQ